MNKERIAQLIMGAVGDVWLKTDESMKKHTSFKVGGMADVLVKPYNTEQLLTILDICTNEGIPYFIMGNGTNLIIRDKGIRGVVIKLFDNFSECTVNGDKITAYAGILLSKLANIALNHGLGGLEFASGIPGTLGGAVVMNAGAYGPEMKDVVVETEYIDTSRKIRVLKGEEHLFGYRSSILQQNGGIVLKSVLKLEENANDKIKAAMDELNRRRKESQPLELPSAGSVFKRPQGYYAGKLIDDCGLRGFSINDAEISQKHCGFIVNKGNASASDITSLIQHVQDTVKSRFGVELKTEVKIVGEE